MYVPEDKVWGKNHKFWRVCCKKKQKRTTWCIHIHIRSGRFWERSSDDRCTILIRIWTPCIPTDGPASGVPGNTDGTLQTGQIADKHVQYSGNDMPAMSHWRPNIWGCVWLSDDVGRIILQRHIKEEVQMIGIHRRPCGWVPVGEPPEPERNRAETSVGIHPPRVDLQMYWVSFPWKAGLAECRSIDDRRSEERRR